MAIGAPWENEGKGVVYIYKGYAKGLRSTYNQRIYAEGAGSFGISISRGFDVDNNNCNGKAKRFSLNILFVTCIFNPKSQTLLSLISLNIMVQMKSHKTIRTYTLILNLRHFL